MRPERNLRIPSRGLSVKSTPENVNMAAFLQRSEANGPGLRAVVWVQGCPFRCEGCANPDFLDFTPRELVPARELARRILGIEGIDGVTFTGGEPFAQALALAEVAHRVRNAGLTVATYTGYTYEQLRAGNSDWAALLQETDLLIDGPYVDTLAGDVRWRGSTNQRLIHLSPQGCRLRPPHDTVEDTPRFELHVSGDEIVMTGFPSDKEAERLLRVLRGQAENLQGRST